MLKKILYLIPLLSLLSLLSLKKKPPIPEPLASKTKTFFSSLLPTKKPNKTTVIAIGDIMLGRSVNTTMLKNNNFKYPFEKTAAVLSSADTTFGNLESPLIENCPSSDTGMIFCGRKEAVEGLLYSGFDVLSIANNHILNQGQKGKEQTINILKANGILPSQNEITIYRANDITFGFLSFDLVTYPSTPLIPLISLKSPTVDILVVSLHWGNEYQKEPTLSQKELARKIIDSGAKIIIGHHPHVTQPVEKYNNGLIFYSLGNFVFDQDWSEETKKGNAVEIIFKEKEIESYKILPIYIQNNSQPEFTQ